MRSRCGSEWPRQSRLHRGAADDGLARIPGAEVVPRKPNETAECLPPCLPAPGLCPEPRRDCRTLCIESRLDRRGVGLDRRRLQGAGMRVPLRRQRRPQHGRALRRRPRMRPMPACAVRSRGHWPSSHRSRRPHRCRAASRSPCPRRWRRSPTLFDAGQCAIVANVGPLVVPTDRSQLQRQISAAAAEAFFAQRPAVGVAGLGSRRRQVRLGRPHRRPARRARTRISFSPATR